MTEPLTPERDRFDIKGTPCTLDALCRREPAWAASRIRAMEAEWDAARAEAEKWRQETISATKDVELTVKAVDIVVQQREAAKAALAASRQEAERLREALLMYRHRDRPGLHPVGELQKARDAADAALAPPPPPGGTEAPRE